MIFSTTMGAFLFEIEILGCEMTLLKKWIFSTATILRKRLVSGGDGGRGEATESEQNA